MPSTAVQQSPDCYFTCRVLLLCPPVQCSAVRTPNAYAYASLTNFQAARLTSPVQSARHATLILSVVADTRAAHLLQTTLYHDK